MFGMGVTIILVYIYLQNQSAVCTVLLHCKLYISWMYPGYMDEYRGLASDESHFTNFISNLLYMLFEKIENKKLHIYWILADDWWSLTYHNSS